MHLPSAADHAMCHPQIAADALREALGDSSDTSTPSSSSSSSVVSKKGKKGKDNLSLESGVSTGNMSVLMEAVQEAMLFPHAWVRSASCRVLTLYLSRRDVNGPRLR